ncbi:MAG: 2-C-methyl-D-erythritol 4-phosphate cytidylyltransferase [Flavobacteriales bacterium]|jgi:2-C-methyl-D-erythritol 4-phosphate cytidylyltransferase
MASRQFVVIVAGGSGSRMKASLPKQFLLLKDTPILAHTLQKFHATLPQAELILVLPKDHFSTWKSLCEKYQITVPHLIVEGGNTRFASVKNGIASIPLDSLVAIHDAVRPLVSSEVILNAFEVANSNGNAIPSLPVEQSLRQISIKGNQHVNRADFCIIQTPQVFRSDILLKAYQAPFQEFFTDDASIVETLGEKINLIEGNKENIKITTQEDLHLASYLI